MNFHSLSRRDLQYFCKKNRIHANMTNAAMAKALEALETVEGIEEIQEALGLPSLNVISPELPQIEPKILQQQEPSPMPRSHRVTVKTRGVTNIALNEEEIQKSVGFQSLNVKTPEFASKSLRTSARRDARHEKPSPLHRSCLKASIDLEEKGKKKNVPPILPNTPATRKAARGIETQSSRRMVKNGDVELQTKTPNEVEAMGEKAIGVVARRSTRLSSRKALEESVTAQSKSKSSSRANSAVKMEALVKENAGEQDKDVERHTKTPKGVEAKGEKAIGAKAIGVVTRRTTRLSSRKALEDSITTQSKSRSSSRANSAVKMKALAKEKAGEQEKDVERHTKTPKEVEAKGEKANVVVTPRSTILSSSIKALEESVTSQSKKDLVKYGDSCDVTVEEHEKKDNEQESHEFYSSIEGNECECEAIRENVHQIQQGGGLYPLSPMVNTKAQEDTKLVPKEEGDNKVTIVALIEKEAGKQEKEEDKKDIAEKKDSCAVALVETNEEEEKNVEIPGYSSSDLAEKRDSCAVAVEAYEEEEKRDSSVVVLVEANEEKEKNVEIPGYSSSGEVKNGDFIAPLVEEVKENNQEVESLCFSSSSTPIEYSNTEVENGDSTVAHLAKENVEEQKDEEVKKDSVKYGDFCAVIVEEHEKKDEELERHEFSSSIEGDKNGEVENECQATRESVHQIQQGGLYPPSPRVNTKAQEDTKLVPKEEGDNKVTIVALIEEVVGKQEKEEDKKDLTDKRYSCAVAVETNEEEEKRDSCAVDVEIPGYSSSGEVKNGNFVAPLVKEVKENNQKVENLCFSSSTPIEDSNIEVNLREKAIGMVTSRSTRMSSRKAMEEPVTSQSKHKSSGRENSAVKMEALAKENARELEKEEVKKDLVKYGDSCAAIVEEHEKKDQEEQESHEFSSSIEGDKNGEVENECEATHETVHQIQQGGLSPRVNTKAKEDTKLVSKEEGNNKVTIVALIEEEAGKREKEEDKKDLAEKRDSCAVAVEACEEEEKRDSCVVALVGENDEKEKNVEISGYSSSGEVKNGDFIAPIVPLVEEVEENNQEVENPCFSSSTAIEDSNIEVENGDSTVAHLQGDKKNYEELEIQVSSFSIEMQDLNVETESDIFNVVHVEEKGRNNQEKSHELFSFCVENSIEHCNGQSTENDLVDDSSKAVEDSVDKFSDAKSASSAISDNLLCSEVTSFPHEEAIQQSSGIEDEARKLRLLFTEKTLNEVEVQFSEKVDARTNVGDEASTTEASGEISGEAMEFASEISVIIGETIDDDLSNTGAVTAIDSVDAQCKESRILVSPIELCTISAAEWSDKDANELSVVIKESSEDRISDSGELTIANGFVDVGQNEETLKDYFFELQIPVSSAEICSEFLTVNSTIESHSIDHLSENHEESVADDAQCKESRILVSRLELCTKISAAEWSDKDANELPVVIKESSEDRISSDFGERTANGFVGVGAERRNSERLLF